MEHRKFGKTDMEVAVLGFGGSEIGFGDVDIDIVEKMLNSMLDSGLNVIDTAECYKDSEEKIGKTVSHRRDEYYLFTKCGHSTGFDEPDWDPVMLRKQIDRSLQRLKTDHVDLVELHTCTLDLLKQGDVIEVLQEAKAAGKTRYIGYSGDREEAKWVAESGLFDALQTSCNVAEQQVIDQVLPIAKSQGMGVIAKRPLANIAWKFGNAEEAGYAGEYWRRLQFLDYGFDNWVETALRFTLAQDLHVAIVGASSFARWQANSEIVSKGSLNALENKAIRDKWHEVAKADWVGQG